MSKMSQLSAEMDEKGVPMEERNSLIGRVSAGMHAAEKTIDTVKPKAEPKPKPTGHGKPSVLSAETIKLAEQIREFAARTHNVVTLNGKNYVKVGVYQYLAAELGLTPRFEFEPESTQDEVWCRCTLIQKGEGELTHTTMYADKTEVFLRDKPDYAVIGMAQTRAFARAMKNVYGYLVELAGFQSIAIEEIDKGDNDNAKN